MNVPLKVNGLHGPSFDASGMYFEDIEEFDDFNRIDNLDQQQAISLYMHNMSREGSVSVGEGGLFDDVAISSTDQPATSASTDSERSADASTKMRRRAQNRASQRAFRERKERHLRGLKATLETLGDEHRRLLGSYSQQSEAVMTLKGRIAELNAQIAAYSVRPAQQQLGFFSQSQNGCQPEFDQFDAFSFHSKPSNSPDNIFWQGQGCGDVARVDMFKLPASDNLTEFEDLLNLP
ncbi:hypothetical protein H2200_001286 [Cladophialophora chaetospira]|uniref:BZIP domain-containing protein n=1 Tax=Cladophialophora chaetospira TaxID=386627 RepID=A0AA38XKL1_9EURO|nr:hypothetical protein H2200_001286 [Cladophialophora chaetospira]